MGNFPEIVGMSFSVFVENKLGYGRLWLALPFIEISCGTCAGHRALFRCGGLRKIRMVNHGRSVCSPAISTPLNLYFRAFSRKV